MFLNLKNDFKAKFWCDGTRALAQVHARALVIKTQQELKQK